VQLSPLKGAGGGAASDSPELQALLAAEMIGGPSALANVRDVDMLGLKRKLVIAEKARRWVGHLDCIHRNCWHAVEGSDGSVMQPLLSRAMCARIHCMHLLLSFC
jgi:hypothetical protein